MEKKPHILVANSMPVDITKKGRFPQMLAPEAVKNVMNPVQKARKPMRKLDAVSRLTWYFFATR